VSTAELESSGTRNKRERWFTPGLMAGPQRRRSHSALVGAMVTAPLPKV
jgi:hypothetical protein